MWLAAHPCRVPTPHFGLTWPTELQALLKSNNDIKEEMISILGILVADSRQLTSVINIQTPLDVLYPLSLT